jgi:hypothetical protein
MAGVTKVALEYPTRFWKPSMSNMGLPGPGVAFQVYDGGGPLVADPHGSLPPGVLTFFALAPFDPPTSHLADSALFAEPLGLHANAVAAPAASAADAASTETATALIAADAALGESCARQLVATWRSHDMVSNKAAMDFETQLATPIAVRVQRWPQEPFISDDPNPPKIHPHPEPMRVLGRPEWDGLLLFAGTEADQSSPGVMEGAVGAARAALALLR